MKQPATAWLIHIFAILHFAASALCGSAGLDDTLLLTALTITLTLLICLRAKLGVEFTAISIILVNVAGYFLGVAIAWVFGHLIHVPVLVHALSTLLTTEALGWGLLRLSATFKENSPDLSERERGIQMGWLILAVTVIFLLRIFINLIFESSLSSSGEGVAAVKAFLYNPLLLLLILGACILFLEYYRKESRDMDYAGKIFSFTLFFITITLLSALFSGLGLPLEFSPEISSGRFLLLVVVSIVVNAGIFSIVYIIYYGLSARRRLEIEREKADKARFQYLILKQQMSPHFLFNSLNVLDSLVQDGSKEDASRFIHQLAGLYRYMLQNEEEDVVSLRDEMDYSRQYAELVKMRWQDALRFDLDVRDADLGRYVVPCSLQLCIENAIKHNALSRENPLVISISSDGSQLIIRNHKSPRVNGLQSTGVGLNYIRQQYLSNGGEPMEVLDSEDEFTVKLPLL